MYAYILRDRYACVILLAALWCNMSPVLQAQGHSGAGDSTGLEGFAHMGLIDDLLA